MPKYTKKTIMKPLPLNKEAQPQHFNRVEIAPPPPPMSKKINPKHIFDMKSK